MNRQGYFVLFVVFDNLFFLVDAVCESFVTEILVLRFVQARCTLTYRRHNIVKYYKT